MCTFFGKFDYCPEEDVNCLNLEHDISERFYAEHILGNNTMECVTIRWSGLFLSLRNIFCGWDCNVIDANWKLLYNTSICYFQYFQWDYGE